MTSPDFLFQQEKNTVRKLALGLSIPCAILPIIVAVAGILKMQTLAVPVYPELAIYMLIYAVYIRVIFVIPKTPPNSPGNNINNSPGI